MANDAVLSASSRSNLLSLQNTQKSIDATQLRLATGKKVNSALDNPQSFFQSQSLTNRASDLTRLLDGIGQSIQTIQEADKGITALTSLVEQASSVAEEAQSELRAATGLATIAGTKDLRSVDDLVADSGGTIVDGDQFSITFVDADVQDGAAQTVEITINDGDTVYDLAAKINDVTAHDATFAALTPPQENGFSPNVKASVDSAGRLKIASSEDGALLRISGGTQTVSSAGFEFLGLAGTVKTENTGDPAAALGAGLRQGGTAIAGRTLTSAQATEATSSVDGLGQVYEASTNLVDAGYLSIAADEVGMNLVVDGETIKVISTTPTEGLTGDSTIQDLIDGINNAGSDKVTASFNTSTGRIELAFADDVGSAELEVVGNTAGAVASFGFGTGASDATSAAVGDIHSENFRFSGSSANLEQYTKDFNKLRSQIDGIVEDANYRGVNLLGGDNLTSFFNEDRSNTLVTEGGDFTVLGMGVEEADFTDAGSIEKSLGQVRNALDGIRAFGSSIANDLSVIQTRQDFTSETINTLKAGSAALVNADLNEEGANLLALQTAQQLGVTSLSLASQSQQSVLRLF